jgi:hypothetical protein
MDYVHRIFQSIVGHPTGRGYEPVPTDDTKHGAPSTAHSGISPGSSLALDTTPDESATVSVPVRELDNKGGIGDLDAQEQTRVQTRDLLRSALRIFPLEQNGTVLAGLMVGGFWAGVAGGMSFVARDPEGSQVPLGVGVVLGMIPAGTYCLGTLLRRLHHQYVVQPELDNQQRRAEQAMLVQSSVVNLVRELGQPPAVMTLTPRTLGGGTPFDVTFIGCTQDRQTIFVEGAKRLRIDLQPDSCEEHGLEPSLLIYRLSARNLLDDFIITVQSRPTDSKRMDS